MIEYAVIYEKDDPNWGASVPDLPGCISIGNTLEEVQESIKEAIQLYRETLIQRGQSVPEPRHKTGSVVVAA